MRKLKAKLLTWEKTDKAHADLMEALRGCFTATCGEFEINLTKERAVVTMVFDAEDIE